MACNCYVSEKIKLLHAMYGNMVDTSKSDKLAYKIKYKIMGIKLEIHKIITFLKILFLFSKKNKIIVIDKFLKIDAKYK